MKNETNIGDQNTGDRNTGDWNTGNRNTGDWNTGDRNTGDWNTGDRNTGDQNTGDQNTGHRNTGDQNTGHRNTGDRNTGNWNTGDQNTGNCNTGFFCTETPLASFFDKPSKMTFDEAREAIPYVELPLLVEFVDSSKMSDQEKSDNPNHSTIGGFLRVDKEWTVQKAFSSVWPKLPKETKEKFLNLPNFDAEKFKKCTGVDVEVVAKTAKIRLSDGSIVSGEIVEDSQ